MNARSSLAQTRNPLLALPSAQRLAQLDQETKEALAGLLTELAKDARARADKAWRTHKPPMAAYWKSIAVYATHTRRALRGATEGRTS